MKAVILPESRMILGFDIMTGGKGSTTVLPDNSVPQKIRPTTLIFNSDFRTGNVSRISSRTSEARFANVRKDLRFALSIMLTIQTVHCADVGTHGGCYRFAHMFDKFIPSDVDKVQHGARNFNSLHYHGALNGSSTES